MQDASITESEQQENIKLSMAVDPEHSGLRFTIVGLFVFFAILLYVIVSLLLPQTAGINIVGVIVGLGGGVVRAWERVSYCRMKPLP